MDTPFPKTFSAWKICFFGCLFGLIWFGTLDRISAQLQLPLPSPSPEKPESKVAGKVSQLSATQLLKDEALSPPFTVIPSLANLKTMTVEECIRIAHERSPILKSLRIRIESAIVGQKGIEKTSRIIHNLISPDLQYRRVQAVNGITAAETELMQAEHDVTFNVVRTYYSAVYAKEQIRLTSDLEKTLKEYLNFVKAAVAEGSVRELEKTDEEVFLQYFTSAVDKRLQAEAGYLRAMEGLRHEMNFDNEAPFTPADESVPDVDAPIDADLAVAQALYRRGEIALARIGVDVMGLEVEAQRALRFTLRQSTAAAASDVHSRLVPLGTRDGEYRPDAIAPDFPTLLVGDRKIRAERATVLLAGQEILLEKTRALVKLETMNAVIRFEEAKKRVKQWKLAADAGAASVERKRKDVNGKPVDTKILNLEGLAAQSRGTYNEVRYLQLMALATIERATAGGIRVNYHPGR